MCFVYLLYIVHFCREAILRQAIFQAGSLGMHGIFSPRRKDTKEI